MHSSTEESKLQERAWKYLCFSSVKEVMNTVYKVYARKTGYFSPVTQYKIHEGTTTGHVAGISYTKAEEKCLWGKVIEEGVGRFTLTLTLENRTGWVGGERNWLRII